MYEMPETTWMMSVELTITVYMYYTELTCTLITTTTITLNSLYLVCTIFSGKYFFNKLVWIWFSRFLKVLIFIQVCYWKYLFLYKYRYNVLAIYLILRKLLLAKNTEENAQTNVIHLQYVYSKCRLLVLILCWNDDTTDLSWE